MYSSKNRLDAAAMFRALGDVAQYHDCSCFELRGKSDFNVLQGFGGPDRQVATGVDFNATFRFFLDEPTLRLKLGAAYKRHSGHSAPFLSEPERDAVDSGNWDWPAIPGIR